MKQAQPKYSKIFGNGLRAERMRAQAVAEIGSGYEIRTGAVDCESEVRAVGHANPVDARR